MFACRTLCFALCALLVTTGCRTKPESTPATVVWISIDGLRGDYISRFNPPTLTRLARVGASTRQLRPIFPSLTFPNHIAQVTGTTVDHHGVPLNAWLDRATGQKYSFPDDSSLIRAEPVWTTAKRQGLRVAVIDWPMSYEQTGAYASDYFDARFDSKQPDGARLAHVADILKHDTAAHPQQPLRLVITYIAHLDTAGHKFGPDAPEIGDALRDTDAIVGRFVDDVTAWFDATHRGDSGRLYVLITTDHGMANVHTVVNLDRLIGGDLLRGAQVITSGPVGIVYLNDVLQNERADRTAKIVAKLRDAGSYLQAWRAQDVPPAFHFADPTRLGEVVVLLSPGYNFTSAREATSRPATGAKGAHGYDPAACPEMMGAAILWQYRHSMHAARLGPVDNTQWHATVCKLLDIQPADGADTRPVELPPSSPELPMHTIGAPNYNAG